MDKKEFTSKLYELLKKRMVCYQNSYKASSSVRECVEKKASCDFCNDRHFCGTLTYHNKCLRYANECDSDIANLIDCYSLPLLYEFDVPRTSIVEFLQQKIKDQRKTFGGVVSYELECACKKYDVKL